MKQASWTSLGGQTAGDGAVSERRARLSARRAPPPEPGRAEVARGPALHQPAPQAAVSAATWTRWVCAATSACSTTAAGAERPPATSRSASRRAADASPAWTSPRAGRRHRRKVAARPTRTSSTGSATCARWACRRRASTSCSSTGCCTTSLRRTGRRSSRSSRGCCARAGACSRASRRRAKHGMPAAQAREVFAAAGLSEIARHRGQGADHRRVLPRGLDQAGGLRSAGRRWSGGPAPYARRPAALPSASSTSTSQGLARDPPDSGSGIS